MREIKYRQKLRSSRCSGQEFHYWGYIDNAFIGPMGRNHIQEDSVDQQYIGLEDKNSKEIYEGDIVKADDYPNSVIVYMEPLACFVGSDRFLDDGSYYFNMWEPYDIQVIGNIYKNPELLKSEEKA